MIFPKQLTALVSRPEAARVFKSGPATQAVAAAGLLARGRDVALIVPGAAELAAAQALLKLLTPGGGDAFARSWAVFPPYPSRETDSTAWGARWRALYALSSGSGPKGALLTLDNLLPKWPSKGVLDVHHLILKKGEELSPDDIMEQVVLWGYERTPMVTRPGEAAMRGDILDIFAPGYGHPLRLEFFGDVIDDMRLFDAASQRSRRELDQALILPAAPAVISPDLADGARAAWKRFQGLGELPAAARQHLEEGLERGDCSIPPGLFYESPTLIADWFPRGTVFMVSGAELARERLEELEWTWKERLDEQALAEGRRWPRSALIQNSEGARGTWLGKPQIMFEGLTLGERTSGLELPERRIDAFEDLFWKPEQRRRPWQALTEAIREWGRERPQVLLSFRTERSRKKFLELAAQDGLNPATGYAPGERGVFALVSPLKKGMELDWNGALILGEDVLQPGAPSRVAVDRDFKGLARHDDLETGDMLVHRDYGLARFGGLHHLTFGGAANDYLLLYYSGDDKLYLSVDRLNLIQRWKGPEGSRPVLDKLGGVGWTRAKDRARKAIEKIARELVEMYAYRKVAKGYAYSPVNELFWEFEASFGFEETPDQEKAIREVLADMEKPSPMDRLVCGDVGFGKTEVALRAAFRAALDGKQAAILCPTTVLAEQHYQTFRRRLAGFPVNVAMLSRFVPRVRQKTILAAVARGEVDILIGTHRLLSKDVQLPNLGLLVLDEEQRFGVRHKERLKQLKKNIDALALTATPIPRTLQLSLSGIRNLSVIETPPVDRKPVRTALIERDDEVLAEVLKREIERGGQVFWVHNRVKSLDAVAERVRKLAPGAKVAMAHGQMRERDLEDAVHKFWHGEVDVLVCTAIVESGLDFPRANTLIVDNAHIFGLGQLYQLRGRVGRSERQAYAYFVVPSLSRVPEPSRKRLQVILDMDYLGAGFQVAMEDLRLRGAGNILGDVQSGSMAKVGLDLFMEMLFDEVRRLRGEGASAQTEPEMKIHFSAVIPESYVSDSRERMRYYKALSSARTGEALDDVRGELRDRFGTLPEEAECFVEVLRLKRLLSGFQAERADLYPNRVVMAWPEDATALSPEVLIPWVQDSGGAARLLPPAGLELRIPENRTIRQGMAWVQEQLSGLTGPEDGAAHDI